MCACVWGGGRGGRAMGQGVGCMPWSSEGPQTEEHQESVSAVTKQSLWSCDNVSKHTARSLKCFGGRSLNVRVNFVRSAPPDS